MERRSFSVYLSFLFIWVGLVISLFSDFLPMPHGAYADQRFTQVAILVLIPALCAWSIGGSLVFGPGKLLVVLPLIACFFIGGVQQVGQPFNWVEPILYILFFCSFCLLGVLVCQYRLVDEIAQLFSVVAMLACFFYGAVTLMVYFFSLTDGLLLLDSVIPPGFVNVRYWSHIATWLLPIFPLVAIVFQSPCWRSLRAATMMTATVWWWLVLHTLSRGSMVALSISLLVSVFLFRRAALPWFKLMLTYFLLGVVCWFVLSVAVPVVVLDADVLNISGVNTTSSGRLPLWKEAWGMSLRNFPFGEGAQSWLTHSLITDEYRWSPKFGHPHSVYLMWAAEYGWISILCLIGIIFWAVRQVFYSGATMGGCESKHSSMLVVYTAAVSAGLIHASVSAVFIVPASMMIGLGVLSVFWALILPLGRVVQKGRQPTRGRWVCIVALLFVGGSWLLEVWRYHQAMLDDLEAKQVYTSQGIQPRFWLYGNYPRAVTPEAYSDDVKVDPPP